MRLFSSSDVSGSVLSLLKSLVFGLLSKNFLLPGPPPSTLLLRDSSRFDNLKFSLLSDSSHLIPRRTVSKHPGRLITENNNIRDGQYVSVSTNISLHHRDERYVSIYRKSIPSIFDVPMYHCVDTVAGDIEFRIKQSYFI